MTAEQPDTSSSPRDMRHGSFSEDAPKTETQRVFISYRRTDCQAQANGLHDGLRHRLPTAYIFMDIDSIPPGVDFEDHIRREIEICDVVLVLIGDEWLDTGPGKDVRRIDEPDDFVRLEIESALSSSRVRVVPVLVEGAEMPRAVELPESIRGLARINAIELSDRRWTADLHRLAALVEQIGHAPELRNMRLSDVQSEAVMASVASMPETFRTKDVSEDPRVLSAHLDVKDLTNYHTMMGRYLAKHHLEMGLRSPESATDDRGAVWHKHSPPQSVHPTPAVGAGLPPPDSRGTTPVGWLMVALPLLSCGLAAWAPALWAASQRRHDRAFRRHMLMFAVAVGVVSILGLVLLVSGPTDADGTPTGPVSDAGGFIWVGATLIATVVAVLQRKPRAQLPGTEQELQRRAQREQYRALIKRDPALACRINVGRPDLQRDYSDGGLLDLNNLSAQALSTFAPMSAEEARSIVVARQQIGRFSSIDEVMVYARLSDATVSRLTEAAVFL